MGRLHQLALAGLHPSLPLTVVQPTTAAPTYATHPRHHSASLPPFERNPFLEACTASLLTRCTGKTKLNTNLVIPTRKLPTAANFANLSKHWDSSANF